jgi:hypothetical protein
MMRMTNLWKLQRMNDRVEVGGRLGQGQGVGGG